MNKIDLTGQVFGRLKVLEEVPNKKRITWKCICECGNYTEVASCHLRSGKIKKLWVFKVRKNINFKNNTWAGKKRSEE